MDECINSSTNEVTKSKEYVDSWFLSLGVNIRITNKICKVFLGRDIC